MFEKVEHIAALNRIFSVPIVRVGLGGLTASVRKGPDGGLWLHCTRGKEVSILRVRDSEACASASARSDSWLFLAGRMPAHARAVEVMVGGRGETAVESGHGLWCAIAPAAECVLVRYLDDYGNAVEECRRTVPRKPGQASRTGYSARLTGSSDFRRATTLF